MKDWLKTLLKALGTAGLAAFAGWAFRFGGSANGQRWVRQAGVGAAEIGALIFWAGFSIWYILIMGCAFAESTYFKKKGTDAKWYNWMECGICYALVPAPALIAHKIYLAGFVVRFLVLVPIITLWRTFVTDVQWSEGGAGAWQLITLPILFFVKTFWFIH